ncbi:MAG TPA: hypothetical protein VMU68_10725 [Acidimicrobiales bacterium]|nr:hypothetical protein [Acidimicrobiales bacterium]
MKRIKTVLLAISIGSVMSLPAVALAASPASAATPSSSGACHGAFANVNGNFGSLGTTGVASSIGGGVPAGPGAAGYDNSAVSGDCTLPN